MTRPIAPWRSALGRAIRVIVSSALLLVVVVTVLFVLLELAPGDPVDALIGDVPVTPEFRAQVVESFGLDRTVVERYFIYLAHVLTGDLGTTFGSSTPILGVILARAVNTLAIAVPAFLIATAGGLLLGTIAARTRSRVLDAALSGGAVVLFSIPNFWLGLMLILVFSLGLGWLPAQGMSAYGRSGITPANMVLPVVTMAATELAYKLRIMRAATIESLGQDYIDTARSKGLSSRRVLWRHGMPNALLPMVTVTGLSLGYVLAGSALVEKVFNWPGMGLLLVDAISKQDNQLVLGVVIVVTVAILIVNILTDLVYGVIDPRLRHRVVGSGRA